MLETVLIPVDGSGLCDRILERVLALCPARPHVVLARVLPDTAYRARGKNTVELASSHLLELAGRLAARGVPVRALLATGDPVERILDLAAEVSPSLIALAAHRRSSVASLFRGSTAERIARRSPCPVLVARPESLGARSEHALHRILVPVDGSEESDSVLPLACELARTHGAELVLLHSLEPVALAEPAFVASPWPPARESAELLAASARLCAGVTVRSRTVSGLAAPAIAAAARAEEADLVALATHGRTGLSRWLHGSVAEQVARTCPVPVLLLRAPRREAVKRALAA